MNLFTTAQVAERLGCSAQALRLWINRHPEYRPTTQMGKASAWVWLESDIQRAQEGRTVTAAIGRGKAKKKGVESGS